MRSSPTYRRKVKLAARLGNGATFRKRKTSFSPPGQLPEPKIEYDYAQSLSGGLVTFYRDTKQFEKAKEWLTVMRDAYGPGPNIYVEFLAGTVYYDAGMLDDAFAIFDTAYKKFKQRPFQGEQEISAIL